MAFFPVSRDTPGLKRLLAVAFLCAVSWGCYFFLADAGRSATDAVELQKRRFETLLKLSRDYIAIGGGTQTGVPSEDPIAAISKAMDSVGLKDNLVQLSQTSKGASVQFDRVYAEQFATFIQEIRKKGLKFLSAEMKVFPVGKERLFSVSFIIGGKS
jgi:hypothetical protein